MRDRDAARALDILALHQLVAEYCYELDLTGGLASYRFFTADGVLDFGKMRISGHDEMKAFYADLVGRATADPQGRTTRHVFNNLRVSFEEDDRATVDFVMLNFSSAGRPPVFGGTVPTIVSDSRFVCRREADGAWRVEKFTGAPVFVGDDPLQNATLLD